ncbi:MAG: lysine/arginine/ornithine ABC transporter substrate-binding protein [Elstera sp.]
MTVKKIVLALATLGVALTSGAYAQSSKTLRLGTEGAYPPFNFTDKNGKLQGFDIEIGDALCAEMKRKCEWVTQDWDGIIPALKAKKFDAIIASMSINEKRKKEVDFTDRYYFTPGMMVARAGSGFKQNALTGKTVGVQVETIHAQFMEARYKDVTLKQYKTQEEANLDLANGRLDLVMADSAVIDEWIKANGGSAKFERVGDFVRDPILGNGAGIAIRKGEKDLVDAFNKAIAAIKANGTYTKINNKYFEFDIR